MTIDVVNYFIRLAVKPESAKPGGSFHVKGKARNNPDQQTQIRAVTAAQQSYPAESNKKKKKIHSVFFPIRKRKKRVGLKFMEPH